MRIVVNIDGEYIAAPQGVAECAANFLRGVVQCNRRVLQARAAQGNPLVPLLESHVRWAPERNGKRFESFDDVMTVYRRGWGDCDDLCAILVAEMHEKKRNADFKIYWRKDSAGVPRLYHVQVRLDGPGGEIVDPSRLLGMGS